MTQRIFITGCAKSGKAVLRRLFYSFKDTTVFLGEGVGEGGIEEFTKPRKKDIEDIVNTAKQTIVMQRRARTIFSSDLISPEKQLKHLKIIRRDNLKVINIIRDGRDVTWERDPPFQKRWIESIEQAYKFADFITFNIRYENLVKFPDEEQQKIAALFGLTIEHKFSDYPNFVPMDEFNFKRREAFMYVRRPIMTDEIGRDLDAYKTVCPPELLDKFTATLKQLGYL